MRTNYFKLAILTVIISSLLVGLSFAQPPFEKGKRPVRGERSFERLPNITDEQQEQIDQLKTAHLKEMLPMRNQIREKEAQLNTLTTAEKVDMAKINNTIEEIGKLKVGMAKMREAHRQDIRKILTDEQRVIFDSKPKGKGFHRGFDGGRGPGHPRCN